MLVDFQISGAFQCRDISAKIFGNRTDHRKKLFRPFSKDSHEDTQTYSWVYISLYLPTTLRGQDVTKGQFSSGV